MKYLIAALIFAFSLTSNAQNCENLVFKAKYPKSKEEVSILCHMRYVVGFSPVKKAPLWTSEKLTADQLNSPRTNRLNIFKFDPLIDSKVQAPPTDFIDNDFDRGHMVNFEDLSDDPKAAAESFYMTNMVAQQFQNNRGVWKALENFTRNIVKQKGEAFVVSGPIFENPARLPGGTAIPSKLYRVIIIPSTKEVYTFIVPNLKVEDPPEKFLSTLSELSKLNKNVNVFPFRLKMKEKTSMN